MLKCSRYISYAKLFLKPTTSLMRLVMMIFHLHANPTRVLRFNGTCLKQMFLETQTIQEKYSL